MEKYILLVDDDEDVVNYLESFFKRFDLKSIKVTSGKEALAVYDKSKIGFVFLDIKMDDLDGITVLKELKKKNPKVKVIMLTGYEEKSFQSKAKELGACDYITKPLNLRELKEKVNFYIKK